MRLFRGSCASAAAASLLLWLLSLCCCSNNNIFLRMVSGDANVVAPALVLDSSKNNSKDFQAEVSRLMDIIISSVYSQKDVFIRELVSNAADALEKVRFLSVSDDTILVDEPALEIRVTVDADNKLIRIVDTGVGMTAEELDHNLGTVARSGTTNFLEAVSQGAADVNLIGQFGVGFYSAFLVADLVTVASRPAHQENQYIWQSNGASYVVTEDPRGVTLTRGTEIVLQLKEDATEYASPTRMELLIDRYNQFLNFPVLLGNPVQTKMTPEEALDIGQDDDALEVDSNGLVSVTHVTYRQINQDKPLWLRNKEDITEEEYTNFYKQFAITNEAPAAHVHFKAEGEIEFNSLIYISGHKSRLPPVDGGGQRHIKIYARRVLVADSLYEFLPKWIEFVKGVVDSDDLPLKVDRESLSQARMLKAVSAKVVGKVMDLLRKMSKDDLDVRKAYAEEVEAIKQSGEVDKEIPPSPETPFQNVYREYGKELRYGCVVDETNRPKLLKLYRYFTTNSGDEEPITLDAYIDRMAEDQNEILYIGADSYNAGMASPHLQKYLKKGWEVIIVTDPYDEHCLTVAREYSGHQFQSLEKVVPSTHMTADEKETHKKLQIVFKPLTDALKNSALNGKVSDVVVSSKLYDAPVALSASMWGSSAMTERMYTMSNEGGAAGVSKSRVLELNPRHPLIKTCLEIVRKEGKNSELLKDISTKLLDAAVILAGFHLYEPLPTVNFLVESISQIADVPKDAVPEEYEFSEEDEAEIAKKTAPAPTPSADDEDDGSAPPPPRRRPASSSEGPYTVQLDDGRGEGGMEQLYQQVMEGKEAGYDDNAAALEEDDDTDDDDDDEFDFAKYAHDEL